MLTPDTFVAQAPALLAGRGGIPWGLSPADIYESWARCVAAGLDSARPPADHIESAASLQRARERHDVARRFALAEMRTLHRLIAGTSFIIAFAAPDGLILDTMSDSRFEASSDARAIRPGSFWSEARCGTNGVGTAAVLGRRVIVQGGEHFFPRFGGLTCAASPIFAPDGTLAGVIDASCDRNARQQHTQALISMATAQIENGLLRERHRHDVLVAFHATDEYLQSSSTGLLAVDRDGSILAANAQARALLRWKPVATGQPFETLFSARFEDVLGEGRKRERQVLTTHMGDTFKATIENPRTLEAAWRTRGRIPGHTSGRTSKAAPRRTDFVASDPVVTRIVGQVDVAAARHIPILIRGETGTGKEQMARHAHAASGRRGAFVPVNCASLPASLVEAELFGYVDGAFTGARRGGAVGLARQADGGTLFLDEIGDMPVALQAVLLRFLDDFTVRPVGGSGGKVDVLLVSATNAGLDKAIAEGRFRADLLYRLNTLEVTLPPLAARGDFEEIARHLLTAIDPDCDITSGAVARLAEQNWPGNIRQLRNMLARLSLGAHDGLIDEEAIRATNGLHPTPPGEGTRGEGTPGDGTLRDSQRARILAAYEQSGGNVSETSRRLNVSRNTIYRALDRKRG